MVGAGDRRVRRLFAAHGVGCELRMLLRDARGPWGTLGLLRSEGGRPFDGGDIAQAARSAPALACEAQPLDGDATGDVAVIIHSADGERLLPHFCDWYGITPRERQVITQLRDASAAKHVARRLGVSVYTVNDHLKAVYRKTGAGCRDELLAAITN